jgi:hypothetical protein
MGLRNEKENNDNNHTALSPRFSFECSSVNVALWRADDYRDLRMYVEARGQGGQ